MTESNDNPSDLKWHALADEEIRQFDEEGYLIVRWVMPMDYRTQSPEVLDKLSPLGRYLVGEPYQKTPEYRPGGGESPLADWCEQHGAPAVRPVS